MLQELDDAEFVHGSEECIPHEVVAVPLPEDLSVTSAVYLDLQVARHEVDELCVSRPLRLRLVRTDDLDAVADLEHEGARDEVVGAEFVQHLVLSVLLHLPAVIREYTGSMRAVEKKLMVLV